MLVGATFPAKKGQVNFGRFYLENVADYGSQYLFAASRSTTFSEVRGKFANLQADRHIYRQNRSSAVGQILGVLNGSEFFTALPMTR